MLKNDLTPAATSEGMELSARDGLDLIKAFCSIPDQKIKAAVLDFVQSIASEVGRAKEYELDPSRPSANLSVTLIAEGRQGVVCRRHTSTDGTTSGQEADD